MLGDINLNMGGRGSSQRRGGGRTTHEFSLTTDEPTIPYSPPRGGTSSAVKMVKAIHTGLNQMDLSIPMVVRHLSRMDVNLQRRLGDIVFGLLSEWALTYRHTDNSHPLRTMHQQAAMMMNLLTAGTEASERVISERFPELPPVE